MSLLPHRFKTAVRWVPRVQALRRNSTARPALGSTDPVGIPLKPVWSVNDLLSSYPKPSISAATLRKLHDLSALTPPEEGTAAHAALTSDMEDLVKLVEAVKLVDVEDIDDAAAERDCTRVPDGRIWAQEEGISLENVSSQSGNLLDESGRTLLRHASRTSQDLYVVDADRVR
jgi:hypothetical protein